MDLLAIQLDLGGCRAVGRRQEMRYELDIDPKSVAVGDGCFVGDLTCSMVTFTRVSEDKGEISHCDMDSGRVVLTMEVDVEGEDFCDITYVDRDYWTITVNGLPAAPGQELEGTFSVNDVDRTIEIFKAKNDYIF